MSVLDAIKGVFEAPAEAATPAASVRPQAVAAATSDELDLTQSCIQLVERDEGDRLTAYPDPATGADPWTIGYGHTGPDVHPGLTITQAQAEALLEQDLAKFEDGVNDLLTSDAGCNDDQFSAMVSLSYNIGLGNFEKSSVLRFHNAGQYAQAADAFLLWDKAAGQVMAGLVRRRHQERELYLGLAIDP